MTLPHQTAVSSAFRILPTIAWTKKENGEFHNVGRFLDDVIQEELPDFDGEDSWFPVAKSVTVVTRLRQSPALGQVFAVQ